MYLQWYPFTRLSNHDKDTLMSEEFFHHYIKTGIFIYYAENWIVTNNYIMKGDGNFRNASLVSPIMYLLALSRYAGTVLFVSLIEEYAAAE